MFGLAHVGPGQHCLGISSIFIILTKELKAKSKKPISEAKGKAKSEKSEKRKRKKKVVKYLVNNRVIATLYQIDSGRGFGGGLVDPFVYYLLSIHVQTSSIIRTEK